jgi:hypothetical protein
MLTPRACSILQSLLCTRCLQASYTYTRDNSGVRRMPANTSMWATRATGSRGASTAATPRPSRVSSSSNSNSSSSLKTFYVRAALPYYFSILLRATIAACPDSYPVAACCLFCSHAFSIADGARGACVHGPLLEARTRAS